MNTLAAPGRKFALCVGAITAASVLLLLGMIDGGQWCALTETVTGMYLTGNVVHFGVTAIGSQLGKGTQQ